MKRRPVRMEPASLYSLVEYLESDGRQIIYTDLVPDNTTGCELDYVSLKSDVDAPIVSSTRIQSVDDNRFYVPYVAGGIVYCGWNARINMGQAEDEGQRICATLNFRNNRIASFRGESLALEKSLAEALSPMEPITLFAYKNHQEIRGRACRLYSLKLSQDERIVVDMRPAVNAAGEAGMLDAVTGRFYANAGAGAFVPGPALKQTAYTPLEYIEATDGHIASPLSYILLDVDVNLRTDSLAFESEHEFRSNGENQAEGSNGYYPKLFCGIRSTGESYYGVGYDHSSSVATGVIPAPSGYAVRRLEYAAGVLRGYVNGALDAEISKGLPSEDMRIGQLGVFVAVGLPLVSGDSGNAFPFLGRKKYFKVWINGKLVYHLIAALDKAGRPGMFDAVGTQFYYSEGESDFIAGPVLQT